MRARSARQPLAARKARDRALVLPLVGLLLLMPPLAGIFHVDARVAGVPFTLAYLFGVWAALILGCALLSRRLRLSDEEPDTAQDITEAVDGPD